MRATRFLGELRARIARRLPRSLWDRLNLRGGAEVFVTSADGPPAWMRTERRVHALDDRRGQVRRQTRRRMSTVPGRTCRVGG